MFVLGVLAGCSEDPAFSDDYFEGRTIRFVPDEVKGGIAEWFYDLDVTLVRQGSNGAAVYVEGLQGCNVERTYEATAWHFDNERDAITIEFGAEWEEYTLDEVDDVDAPSRGRFSYEASLGIQMTGSWELGQQSSQCTISYSSGNGGGATSSDAYCDCLHCSVTSCAVPIQGSCCSQPTFRAEP